MATHSASRPARAQSGSIPISATIQVNVTCGVTGGAVVADVGRVWTTSPCGAAGSPTRDAGATVVGIDPAQNVVVSRALPIPLRASYIALGLNSVWAVTGALQPFGQLFRLDDETGKELGRLRLPDWGPVAADLGAVWLAGGKQLLRIEPAP